MRETWVGTIPREGNGYPLQYSGLENSMDCIVQGVVKSQTILSHFHFHLAGVKKWHVGGGEYLPPSIQIFAWGNWRPEHFA